MAGDTWGPLITLDHFGFVLPALWSPRSWGRTRSPSSQQGAVQKSDENPLPMVGPVQLWFEPLA